MFELYPHLEESIVPAGVRLTADADHTIDVFLACGPMSSAYCDPVHEVRPSRTLGRGRATCWGVDALRQLFVRI